MNEEIKEILDKAKEISNYGYDEKQHTRMFNQFEAKALLDYITNLQEENRVLKELNVCVGCNNNPDYKSRCEKAINILELSSQNKGICTRPETDTIQSALNILNGGDKE